MLRPLGHQPPQRPLGAIQVGNLESSIDLLARIDQHVGKLCQQPVAKFAHRAEADRVDRRVPAPVLDLRAQLLAATMVGHGLGRQNIQQQLPPALEEHGPIVELNAEHVGLGGVFRSQQVIANLLRPRPRS